MLKFNEFKTTQYSNEILSNKWWHRELDPITSILVLVISLLIIFGLGYWFAWEYKEACNQFEANQHEQSIQQELDNF